MFDGVASLERFHDRQVVLIERHWPALTIGYHFLESEGAFLHDGNYDQASRSGLALGDDEGLSPSGLRPVNASQAIALPEWANPDGVAFVSRAIKQHSDHIGYVAS